MTCGGRKGILRVRVRIGTSFAGVLLRQVVKGETTLDREKSRRKKQKKH